MFASVILPLPLFSTFTYSVPPDLVPAPAVGSRVLVQFGRRKFYTGIVEALSPDPPGSFEVKPIMAVLDEAPILRYPQLRLWNWISEYYLCAPGDVFKVAVPSGLKPESETWLTLNPDFESPEGFRLSDKQAEVIALLQQKKKLRLSDVEDKLDIRRGSALLSRMLDAGILEIAESLSSRYRPKSIPCVSLAVPVADALDATSRAPQQERLLLAYLSLTQSNPSSSFPVSTLLSHSSVSPAVLSALVSKGVFVRVKQTLNRFNPSLPTAEEPLTVKPGGVSSKSLSMVNPTISEQSELRGGTRTASRLPRRGCLSSDLSSDLSPVQSIALSQITDAFSSHAVTLLRGVTGSGKTELYIRLIASALDAGNQALFLVPEISLTTQLTDRLRAVFGSRLLVYHSRFSDNERVDIWKAVLQSSDPLVVIGARSAVFLPFGRLGLVVVDEEHDTSYKQQDPAPRYNARDTAIVLASMHGCKTLLGSATPSIESYYKALTGKYGLVELLSRYDDSPLPDVHIVDMRLQRREKTARGSFSKPLVDAANGALADSRQVILFQNRRGFAPVTQCRACGWTPKCQNCDVSLVYHKNTDSLHCHYCGFSMRQPSLCPACGENAVEVFGYGTERIEEDVARAFPDASISRMDLDTTRNKDAYHDIITDFSEHKTDILVGTQMVTKGLDFGKVRVVGVLNADTILNFPDFRSNEKGFNMLEQVAGRAGRRKEKGEVYIQTTAADNKILDYVRRHDYVAYYEAEIAERAALHYPPFSKLIMVYVKNKDAAVVEAAAGLLAAALRDIFGERVLGPDTPFVSRVATWYLRHIMLKIETTASLPKVKAILRSIYESLARDPRIKSSLLYYDVDPL